jgi:segregation and condensation protein A
MANYFLKLDHFEGPLDLLLHLIKVNEIDVFNIDIYLLTTKYLEYLRLMDFRDLSEAGEFLQMAASLIEIKSKMLLPNEKRGEDDDMDDDDPRRTLQERLIEYERIKSAADFLTSRPQLGIDIVPCKEWKRLEPKYEHVEAPLTGDPATMVICYEQILQEFSERKPTKIVEAKTHLVSVEEKINELQKLLETVQFALFQGFYKKFASRYELVVYILAVLELVKWDKAHVYQNELLGPLWLYRADLSLNVLPLSAEEKERVQNNVVATQRDESSTVAEA